MVDEEQYRRAYRELIRQPCPFEKAILSRTCGCCRSERTNIAEREAVNCNDQAARNRCCDLLELFRDKANFALGLSRTPGKLPHAKNIRIQCGGLIGLQQSVTNIDGVDDIFALVDQACAKYGDIERFPFSEIVQAVNRFEGRKRRKKR